MRKPAAFWCARALAVLCIAEAVLTAGALAAEAPLPPHASGGGSGEPPVSARMEARSEDLLAVGLVHGDRMSIHLSRLIDNAPVRDAAVTVVLRGAGHMMMVERPDELLAALQD